MKEAFLLLTVAACFLVQLNCSKESSETKVYDVIVVGAGIAGLAAAEMLQEYNYSYVILEARNRIGGRIHTHDFDGMLVELGAQYIFGERNNSVYKMAYDLGQLYRHYEPDLKVEFKTSLGHSLDEWKVLAALGLEKGATKSKGVKNYQGSYGDFIIPKIEKRLINKGVTSKMDVWLDLLKKILTLQHFGDSVYHLGLKGVQEYVFPKGFPAHTWKNGYKTLLNILMGEFGDNYRYSPGIKKEVKLDHEVIKIRYSENGVNVTCGDENVFRGKRVILTLPLGVLKNLPDVFFEPPLPPKKLSVIQALKVNSLNHIFLKYTKRWWRGNLKGIYFGFSNETRKKYEEEAQYGAWPLSIVGFTSVEQHPKLLKAMVIGDGSRKMEQASDAIVKSACVDILKRILPNKKNVPEPLAIVRSKWNTDPFSRGSQSYRSWKSDKEGLTPHDLREPITFGDGNPVVMFAGEATSLQHSGTVHGAMWSGREEVLRMKSYDHR